MIFSIDPVGLRLSSRLNCGEYRSDQDGEYRYYNETAAYFVQFVVL